MKNKSDKEANKIIDLALSIKSPDPVLFFNTFVPWQDRIVEYNKNDPNSIIKWVLFKAIDETYRVQAVPLDKGSFNYHEAVKGNADEQGFLFCHPTGFLCGYKTKLDAIRAVAEWLKQ